MKKIKLLLGAVALASMVGMMSCSNAAAPETKAETKTVAVDKYASAIEEVKKAFSYANDWQDPNEKSVEFINNAIWIDDMKVGDIVGDGKDRIVLKAPTDYARYDTLECDKVYEIDVKDAKTKGIIRLGLIEIKSPSLDEAYKNADAEKSRAAFEKELFDDLKADYEWKIQLNTLADSAEKPSGESKKAVLDGTKAFSFADGVLSFKNGDGDTGTKVEYTLKVTAKNKVTLQKKSGDEVVDEMVLGNSVAAFDVKYTENLYTLTYNDTDTGATKPTTPGEASSSNFVLKLSATGLNTAKDGAKVTERKDNFKAFTASYKFVNVANKKEYINFSGDEEAKFAYNTGAAQATDVSVTPDYTTSITFTGCTGIANSDVDGTIAYEAKDASKNVKYDTITISDISEPKTKTFVRSDEFDAYDAEKKLEAWKPDGFKTFVNGGIKTVAGVDADSIKYLAGAAINTTNANYIIVTLQVSDTAIKTEGADKNDRCVIPYTISADQKVTFETCENTTPKALAKVLANRTYTAATAADTGVKTLTSGSVVITLN